jgi:hypothetical protein
MGFEIEEDEVSFSLDYSIQLFPPSSAGNEED